MNEIHWKLERPTVHFGSDLAGPLRWLALAARKQKWGGCGSWRSGRLVAVPVGNLVAGTVREAALERHHQVGIPFCARGKKDSHHRRRPV
jgi:hypothetical protein